MLFLGLCVLITPLRPPSCFVIEFSFIFRRLTLFIRGCGWQSSILSLQSPEVSHCFPRFYSHFVLKGFQLRLANGFLMEIHAHPKEGHYKDNIQKFPFLSEGNPEISMSQVPSQISKTKPAQPADIYRTHYST